MRQTAVRYYLEPIARLVFEAIPEANSVLLVVAQYWNDESDDATHVDLVVSSERSPKWPSCLDASVGGTDRWERSTLNDAINTVIGGGWPDDNYRNIVAFASQCLPDCHQEMSQAEAYRPYAVATRGATPSQISCKITGKTRRKQYEDEFNVGYHKVNYVPASYGSVTPLKDMPLEVVRDRFERGLLRQEAARLLRELKARAETSDEPIATTQLDAIRAIVARAAALGPLIEDDE
jgi:hypothetical protein